MVEEFSPITSKERISVVVPVYKVEDYLDDCVRSIINQTHSDLEIILVDDGSPDKCPEICEEWAKKDNRIKVIHKKNGGLSDARNAGIDIATGQYLAFVDSDDWIRPEMYEKMLLALKKESADFCSCSIHCFYEDGRESSFGYKGYIVAGSEKMLEMLYKDTNFPVSAFNKLYKRSCWETMRFPVGKICEDAFTTYLQIDQASRIVHLPEEYYCYRIRPQSIMTSAFTLSKMDEEEAWRKNVEFMKNHYPKIYPLAYDFYLQKTNILIAKIPENKKQRFKNEYKMLKDILKKNIGYILFYSHIGLKQRIKLLFQIFKY